MFDPMLIERYKSELMRYAKKTNPDAPGDEADGSAAHGTTHGAAHGAAHGTAHGTAHGAPSTGALPATKAPPQLHLPASMPIPQPFPSANSDAIRFLREHPDFGLLRVQVTDVRGAPVGGATVAVAAESGARALCAVPTNGSGVADGIALPANPSGGEPFARYDIAVAHPSYEPAHFTGVAIFCGVKSIQQVHLTPRKSIDKASVSAV